MGAQSGLFGPMRRAQGQQAKLVWLEEKYMKILKLTSMAGVWAALVICFVAQAGAQEVKGYTVLSATDLKRMQESGKEILIIDTLAGSTYTQGHIPGAKNFEFPNEKMDSWDTSKTAGKSREDFVALLGEDRDKPLIFYCLDEK
jgi:rhodanese-related sulfurtransferase